MADKADRTERAKDKIQPTPNPTRPELFSFLERHFTPTEKPQWIELRQAYGPGLRKYGSMVIQKEFKMNQPNPVREILVALSNEFLAEAQMNCDGIGKPHKYAVLMKNNTKGDGPYGVFVIACRPKQDVEYDPAADDEDDEVGGIMTDAKRRDGLLQYSLDHLKHGDEHERYRQDQFSTAMGDIIAKYQHLADTVMSHNLEMQKEHRELFKVADEALSRKSERELAAKMQDFKLGMMENAFTYLKQMVPVVVQQINGKAPEAGAPSVESIGIMTFLEGLTEKQGEALFGTFDEKKVHQPDGIFTPAQASIFLDVAQRAAPPDALDRLLSGEHAVTEEQVKRAQSIVSAQQFMPLVALVMTRKKKEIEASSTTPAHP